MRATSAAIVLVLSVQALAVPLSSRMVLDPALPPDEVAEILAAYDKLPTELTGLDDDQIADDQSPAGPAPAGSAPAAPVPAAQAPAAATAPLSSAGLQRRGSILGAAGDLVDTGVQDALKSGALGGIGALIGGGLAKIFGGDNSNSQSSRRELVELLAREPLVLPDTLTPDQIAQIQSQFAQFANGPVHPVSFKRGNIVGEVVDTGVKDALKSGALGGIGALIGGGLAKLFGGSDSSQQQQRAILEYIEARANQELAARAYKREVLSSLLEMREINELD